MSNLKLAVLMICVLIGSALQAQCGPSIVPPCAFGIYQRPGDAPVAATLSCDRYGYTFKTDCVEHIGNPDAQTVRSDGGPMETGLRAQVADLDKWLTGHMQSAPYQSGIPGAVVAIVDREGSVLQRGFGVADVATGRPVSANQTLFRPGSISKLFTWTAVMQLIERGVLDLDADINGYLDFQIPDYEGAPITLRHLMTHRPGFQEAHRYLMTPEPMALQTYVQLALPERVFPPGQVPAYSNYGTSLAGYIVERASGMPFATYIDENIFDPLGMATASFEQPLPLRLARLMSNGYRPGATSPGPFEIVAAPAGGLSASGEDIGRFMVAHLNEGEGVLAPETAAVMQNYNAGGISGLETMALGFYEKRIVGHRGIGHGGDTTLFHSDLTLFPDLGVGLYVSLNGAGQDGRGFAMRRHLLEEFVRRFMPAAETDIASALPNDAAARMRLNTISGTYSTSRNSFTNFMSILEAFGQTKVRIAPDGSLSVPSLDRAGLGPFEWTEIAPYVWEDHHSGIRLAAEVVDGTVLGLSTSLSSPFAVLTPVEPLESSVVLLTFFAGAMTIIVFQAVLWPWRAVIRWIYGTDRSRRNVLVSRLKGTLSWTAIMIVLGWVVFMSVIGADATILGGPWDPAILVLLIATPLTVAGLLLTSIADLGWPIVARRSWINHAERIASVIAAMAVAVIVIQLNLYGLNLRF